MRPRSTPIRSRGLSDPLLSREPKLNPRVRLNTQPLSAGPKFSGTENGIASSLDLAAEVNSPAVVERKEPLRGRRGKTELRIQPFSPGSAESAPRVSGSKSSQNSIRRNSDPEHKFDEDLNIPVKLPSSPVQPAPVAPVFGQQSESTSSASDSEISSTGAQYGDSSPRSSRSSSSSRSASDSNLSSTGAQYGDSSPQSSRSSMSSKSTSDSNISSTGAQYDDSSPRSSRSSMSSKSASDSEISSTGAQYGDSSPRSSVASLSPRSDSSSGLDVSDSDSEASPKPMVETLAAMAHSWTGKLPLNVANSSYDNLSPSPASSRHSDSDQEEKKVEVKEVNSPSPTNLLAHPSGASQPTGPVARGRRQNGPPPRIIEDYIPRPAPIDPSVDNSEDAAKNPKASSKKAVYTTDFLDAQNAAMFQF